MTDPKEAAIQRLAEEYKIEYAKREKLYGGVIAYDSLMDKLARIAIEQGVVPTAMEMRGVSDREWMERHIPWDAVCAGEKP